MGHLHFWPQLYLQALGFCCLISKMWPRSHSPTGALLFWNLHLVCGYQWFFDQLEQRTQQNLNARKADETQQNRLALGSAICLWLFLALFHWFLSALGAPAESKHPWTDCVTGIRRHPWLHLTGRLGNFLGTLQGWAGAPWSAGIISGRRILPATHRHTEPQARWPWSPGPQ